MLHVVTINRGATFLLSFLSGIDNGRLEEDPPSQGTHQTGTDAHLHVLELADDGLILVALDAWEWPYDTEDVVVLLVLFDRLLRRIMVFLVAKQDVIEERALARQEGTGDFQSFGMPELGLLLSSPFHRGRQVLLS